MPSLFQTEEQLDASAPILGYRILKLLKHRKVSRMSLFDISDQFVGEKWFDARHLYFALLFLFSVGLIDLVGSYVVLHAQD